MYNFSIPMALMDFVPVVFFGVTLVLLQQDLYNKMGKGSYALFAAGTINVFAAGFLKALWKLLYASGVCDFTALNQMFLPVQSIGFLLIGAGLVGMLCRKHKKTAALAVVPPVLGGSMVFIVMMVAGLGCLCACVSILAAKMKKKWLIAVFALSFVTYMAMGYLSSQDSTSAAVNWIEQSINCVGQGLLMWGVIVLHKAGLKNFEI